ncbi:MAG: metal-sulfur cluster assembly factor [bacterium]
MTDQPEKEKEILEALKDVEDPELGFSILEAGLIDEVKVEGDKVSITYHLTAPFCPPPFALYIGKQIKEKAQMVEGINKVEVTLQGHIMEDEINKMLREEKPSP